MIPTHRQIHLSFLISRPDGTWQDLSDYVTSANVDLGNVTDIGTGTGADIGVRTLEITLNNDGQNVLHWDTETLLGDSEAVFGDTEDVIGDSNAKALPFLTKLLGTPKWARHSFAPRDRKSSWNTIDGQWKPLLWPYREAVLSVAITEPGVTPLPEDWVTLFEGYLGDNIPTEQHSITLQVRDKSKRLQDALIAVAKTYTGPIAPEALIQAIINDYVEHPPTLYCPVASGITFEEMTVEYTTVWGAIQEIANQTGWYLGYRWNGTQFVLTYMEPPRTKTTADIELGLNDIYKESLETSDADIRNALTLTYRDRELGRRVTLHHTDHPEFRNEASKTEYGDLYRIMQIEEADTSLIETQAQALAFGAKCLWDLSEISATDRLDLPLLPEVDVFSTIEVDNPFTSSSKEFYAVQSVRHSLQFGENGKFRTEILATGRVVGARTKWLEMETRPGRSTPIGGGDIIGNPITDNIVVASKEAPLDVRRAAHFICDGVDDHVQVQAAIDHCHTIGGGTVQLTKGTFSVTADQITLKNNVTLQGIGLSTIIKCPGAKTSGGKVLGARTLENVTIRNLAMEIIDLPYCTEEFTGEGYTVKSPAIRDLLYAEEYVDGKWVEVTFSKVEGWDKTSVYMSVSGTYRITYETQHTIRGISFGIDEEWDTDYVKNILIENVTITNPGDRGINILSSETISHNCKIKDVVVNNTPNAFIESFCFCGIKGLTCSENTSNRGDVGVMIIDCADVIIANNTIYKPATFGIIVYASAYGANYVISNNNISDSNCGINIQGGKGTLITNNYVFRVTNQGIYIAYGEAHTLQLNKITGLQYSTGVSIQPGVTDTYLANNDLSDTATKIDDQGTNTYYGPGNKV